VKRIEIEVERTVMCGITALTMNVWEGISNPSFAYGVSKFHC
jgi:hypothetical protein